ncbi:MAG: hypothetical protein ACTTKN_09115 [Phocaeicola sp.]|uniref:hypothetical protein n=1 Tax=Phocaeicola sp. TaxID=2773926 RepID=UPI003F9EFFF1
MKQQDNKKTTERQRRNMQYAEERIELIDTIRDMIDIELERWGVMSEGDPHPENPPPGNMGRESPGSSSSPVKEAAVKNSSSQSEH